MKNTFCNISNLKTCNDLLKEYEQEKKVDKGKLLRFNTKNISIAGSNKKLTVYNPTKPILKDGKRFMIARVEPRDSERSKVVFFVEEKDGWQKLNHPIFDLQDPFYIENIQGWQVLGGVQIEEKDSKIVNFRTLFYKYKNCATDLIDENGNLSKPFAVGPDGMKDIRLIELKNGKIGVFTRPSKGKAKPGKIAYIEIENLDELEDLIPKAKIIKNLFHDNEWGGVNEVHLLKDGNLGILGHIAHFEGTMRHYYSMSFLFDAKNHTASRMKILATSDSFPAVKSKNMSLGKIVFSGGLQRNGDGRAELYLGVGDTRVGALSILDPFFEFENEVHTTV